MALQSCVYSPFIPGIFSVLLVPMLVDTVEWDSLKCFSAFVVTDCPVTVCVCVVGVISDL